MNRKTKALPGALDFGIDWSDWLGADTIATSSWAVDAGLTLDSDSNDATSTALTVSGGTVGATYTCINTVTTAGGLIDRRALHITVREYR